MNTELTSTQIAQLTAIMTGGGFKRAATKEAAAKRFLSVATEKGIKPELSSDILARDFAAASNMLGQIMSAGSRIEPATKTTPGLARLHASKNAEAIRLSTIEESKAALAKAKDTRAKVAARAADEAAKAPKKAAKAPKPPKAPKEKKAGDATRTRIDGTAKITVVAEKNPKKQGSRSYARFALYSTAQTVDQFIAACVAAGFPANEAKADLSWDRRHGFIAVG